MLDEAATAVVLLLFLTTAVERTVEVMLAPFDGIGAARKRLMAVALSLIVGGAIAFGLELDLVGALLGERSLSQGQGYAATAIALAGGSAPAHELIRLVEEMKAAKVAAVAGLEVERRDGESR